MRCSAFEPPKHDFMVYKSPWFRLYQTYRLLLLFVLIVKSNWFAVHFTGNWPVHKQQFLWDGFFCNYRTSRRLSILLVHLYGLCGYLTLSFSLLISSIKTVNFTPHRTKVGSFVFSWSRNFQIRIDLVRDVEVIWEFMTGRHVSLQV